MAPKASARYPTNNSPMRARRSSLTSGFVPSASALAFQLRSVAFGTLNFAATAAGDWPASSAATHSLLTSSLYSRRSPIAQNPLQHVAISSSSQIEWPGDLEKLRRGRHGNHLTCVLGTKCSHPVAQTQRRFTPDAPSRPRCCAPRMPPAVTPRPPARLNGRWGKVRPLAS